MHQQLAVREYAQTLGSALGQCLQRKDQGRVFRNIIGCLPDILANARQDFAGPIANYGPDACRPWIAASSPVYVHSHTIEISLSRAL